MIPKTPRSFKLFAVLAIDSIEGVIVLNVLRNKEVKQFLLVLVMITLLASVIGFSLEVKAGIVVLVSCGLLCAVSFFATAFRYRQIAHLSEALDEVLHGGAEIDLDLKEGELSILQIEIQKMVTRLKEQSDTLQKDKRYLSESLADIAHQLRTPLTTINMITGFLGEPALSDERRIELIRELKELLARVDWLITSLLKISKIEAGTAIFMKKSVVIRTLLDDAIQPLLVPLELRGIALEINGPEYETVEVDRPWMSEALSNLVKNSMEHTPAEGRITLQVTKDALCTTIRVSDTGSGIAKEDLPHVFERFYQGKHTGTGNFGVGLALARMIITEQNGTIKVENNASGVGACFTVKIYHQLI